MSYDITPVSSVKNVNSYSSFVDSSGEKINNSDLLFEYLNIKASQGGFMGETNAGLSELANLLNKGMTIQAEKALRNAKSLEAKASAEVSVIKAFASLGVNFVKKLISLQ